MERNRSAAGARVQPDHEQLDDVGLARRFGAGDEAAVRLVTGRNNQRLFRVAWSILKDRSEAEDAVQAAYLRAFAGAATFKGDAALSTWLTRIAVNEALGRLRSRRRRRAALDDPSVIDLDAYREKLMRGSTSAAPDEAFAREQLRRLLENAVAKLPDDFRTVFVLREIEQLAVADVADALGIPEATVKTRCLRARRRLQKELAPTLDGALAGSFPFAGADCERVTERLLGALRALPTPAGV